jgi:hypothetical protein
VKRQGELELLKEILTYIYLSPLDHITILVGITSTFIIAYCVPFAIISAIDDTVTAVIVAYTVISVAITSTISPPTVHPLSSSLSLPLMPPTTSFCLRPTLPAINILPAFHKDVYCESHRDMHDISYYHCMGCHFKENGYTSYYYEM